MSSEDDYVRLIENFQRLGYQVSRRMIGSSDTIVVASKPEVANGITVYHRSVQLYRSPDGQWHTIVCGVTLPWLQSLESLRSFVSDLMGSEDAAYLSEQHRRLCSVSGRA